MPAPKRKKEKQKPNNRLTAMCEKITENDKIALYLDEENERLCLYVKASGKYWWPE